MTREANGRLLLSGQTLKNLPVLAEALATVLASGDVVLLQGALGAGKTTFTQFLAHALGLAPDQYVTSPSFALMHAYSGRLPIFHMDLYRLVDEEDVEDAGLLDFFEQPGVCVVEWPDRLGSLIPDERLDITLEHVSPELRHLTLTPQGSLWRQKTEQIAELLAMPQRMAS